MKKFLSICLCAALLTGGFGGGLSAFAAKTSTEVTSTDEILYPASDTPDKINEEGQKAINAQFYTTEDGVKVEPTAIGVVRELDFPASKDVSYIRLFYYPHGCTPPAEKFYLLPISLRSKAFVRHCFPPKQSVQPALMVRPDTTLRTTKPNFRWKCTPKTVSKSGIPCME